MDILTLIQNKQKEMASKKQRTATFKPAAGAHTYRILPSWNHASGDKKFWHDFGIHFIKSPTSGDKPEAVYVCAEKTYERPCEICDSIRHKIGTCADDKLLDYLKKASSAQRYLVNVLHLSGPEPTKVQVMEVGQGVFDALLGLIPEYNDITDLDEGTDVKITREGSGLDTKYAVMPCRVSKPVSPAVLKDLVNLDDYVALENPVGQAKALSAVGSIIGISHSSGAALPRSTAAALADMSDDIEEAEFTPVKKVSGSDLTADDLDDLDELLG